MPSGDDPVRQGIWDALQTGCVPVFFGRTGGAARAAFSELRLDTRDANDWSVLVAEEQLGAQVKQAARDGERFLTWSLCAGGLTIRSNDSAFARAEAQLSGFLAGRVPLQALRPLRRFVTKSGFFLPPIATTAAERARALAIGEALVRLLEGLAPRAPTQRRFIASALPRITYTRSVAAQGPGVPGDAVSSLAQMMLRRASLG